MLQLFSIPRDAPMLYYLHPDVSFFKGNGFTTIGPYLDMPGMQQIFCPKIRKCSPRILEAPLIAII
jgi:hypothetical protein